MAALPYMQLYVADYLADTMHLTTEEHGAYLLLIFNYWQTGKPIPVSRLARITRLSNERWTDVERSLVEFFNERGNEWVHDRIERDLDAVHATQAQRIAAGKASAEARKQAAKPRKARSVNARSTPVEKASNGKATNKEEKRGEESKELNLERGAYFAMPLEGWEPEPKSFKAICFANAVKPESITQEQLAAFRSYWSVRPEKEQSQAQWEYQLVQHLNHQAQYAKASGSTADGQSRSENTAAGQRPARQRSLSAVDQVRAAITEREAREAAAAAHGQALDQDDGDVRPSLDGEFRRIS